MASANTDDNIEQLTNCPICFEAFNNPKYLPCLHTFCEACIDTYITSSSGSQSWVNSRFDCPVCRSEVPAPDTTKIPEEWAKCLPNNHLIISLMDQLKIKKKEKNCDSCERNGKESTPTCWCKDCREAICENCADSHKYVKVTMNHVFVPIEDIRNEPTKSAINEEFCTKHKNKILEIFCFDHDVACCSTCIVYHRKCDHVTTLEAAAQDVTTRPDVDKIIKDMDDQLSTISFYSDRISSNIPDLEKQKQSMREDVVKLKRVFVDYLDELEQQFLKHLEVTHEQQKSELQSKLAQLQNRYKITNNENVYLETSRAYGSNIQVFLDSRKLANRVYNQNTYLKQCRDTILRVDNNWVIRHRIEDFKDFLPYFGQLKYTGSEYVMQETNSEVDQHVMPGTNSEVGKSKRGIILTSVRTKSSSKEKKLMKITTARKVSCNERKKVLIESSTSESD